MSDTKVTYLINFGKYNGNTLDALLKDFEYCRYLVKQPWLHERSQFQFVRRCILNKYPSLVHYIPGKFKKQLIRASDTLHSKIYSKEEETEVVHDWASIFAQIDDSDVETDEEDRKIPEEIVDDIHDGRHHMYLIKWCGLDDSQNTFEHEIDLSSQLVINYWKQKYTKEFDAKSRLLEKMYRVWYEHTYEDSLPSLRL